MPTPRPGKFFILILVFLCYKITALGQDRPLIDGDFNELSFPRFAERIESFTRYHFFFDPAEVDTLVINLRARRATLPQLLDQVFKNTVFHYAIDPFNNVYVTRLNTIRTSLTPPGPGDSSALHDTLDMTASGIPPGTKTLRSSLENKLFEIGTAGRARSGSATLTGRWPGRKGSSRFFRPKHWKKIS